MGDLPVETLVGDHPLRRLLERSQADLVTAIADQLPQTLRGCLQVELKAQGEGVFEGLDQAPFAFRQVDTARREIVGLTVPVENIHPVRHAGKRW